MNDTITILITGTGGIILAGVSYVVGHVRGRASRISPNVYAQGYAQAKRELMPAINSLQAELTRLTDRDEHGRYVRNEPQPMLEVVTHPKFGDVLVTPKLGGTSARSGVRASSPKPIKPKA